MWLARVLSGVVGIGIVIAGAILWRLVGEHRARWLVAVLAAYGGVAFLHAMATGITGRTLLSGHGLFQALPFVLQGAFIGAFVVLPVGWVVAVIRAGIPRFAEGSPRRAIYQAVTLTICIGLVLTSIPYERTRSHLDSGRTDPASSSDRAAQLKRSLRAIEDGERESPRDSWDPQYVVDQIGHDPEALFTWVRDNTYWIPYRGVLRGAVGVLMDRQGNSLDRALLPANLLEKAGYQVRLAHGELTREVAIDLLPDLNADRAFALSRKEPSKAPDQDVQLVAAQYQLAGPALSQTLTAQEAALTSIAAKLQSRVTHQTARLLSSIDRPAPQVDWSKRFGAALGALRDHWWVQRQNGGKWLDLDLLGEDRKAGAALVAAQETIAVNDVPAESHHEITFRIIAEQWSSRKLKQRTALEHVLRPSELIEQPIVLQFMPTNWIDDHGDTQPSNDWQAEVMEQEEWGAALVVGTEPAAVMLLSASGDDPLASEGGGGPMGPLGAAIANALGSRRPGKAGATDTKILSAVWLEYEIRVPGEQPRTIRRSVFDLLGPAARVNPPPSLALDKTKRLTRGMALTMRTEIVPMACRVAPEFLAHLATQAILGNRDLLDIAAGRHLQTKLTIDQLFDRSAPPVSSLYDFILARLEWSRDNEHIYIDRPNIFTSHSYAAPAGRGVTRRDATDMVANEVGVGLEARDSYAVRIAQGVLDTNAESLLRVGENAFGNTGDAFDASRKWMTIASDPAAVEKLALPDDVRRQIAVDLRGGYAVVAPEAPIANPQEPFSGWWRIDRATWRHVGPRRKRLGTGNVRPLPGSLPRVHAAAQRGN